MSENNCCCEESTLREKDCCRTKERSEEEYKSLVHRLNRIEGQIRGIKGMLDKSAYCPDILTQVAAVNAALNAFGRELLSSHIRTCVVEDIRAGKEDTVTRVCCSRTCHSFGMTVCSEGWMVNRLWQ